MSTLAPSQVQPEPRAIVHAHPQLRGIPALSRGQGGTGSLHHPDELTARDKRVDYFNINEIEVRPVSLVLLLTALLGKYGAPTALSCSRTRTPPSFRQSALKYTGRECPSGIA